MYQDSLYIYVSAQEESYWAFNLLVWSHIPLNELRYCSHEYLDLYNDHSMS